MQKKKLKTKNTKNKKSKKKLKNILKKALLGFMVFVAVLPIFSGLMPQQQTAGEIDPKLAQAYLQSMSQSNPDRADSENAGQYEVLSVLDDASITIHYEGQEETVKLIGVESAQDTSGDNLERLLSDNYVDLTFDEIERDNEGNLLAYVYSEDGRFLNEEVLRDGYAKLADETQNTLYEDVLRKAQDSAIERKVGVWAP